MVEPSRSPLAVGRTLAGRYRLERRIAGGGMASVWEATDDVLARRVAVKLLHQHLAEDDTFVARFRREAVAAARLAHPSIVSIYDTVSGDLGSAGPDGNGDCEAIVMELVRGPTLRAELDQRGSFEPAEAVAVVAAVADALEAAHRAGIVHRDVKPANVLLSADGRVLVADFGIAKAADELDLTGAGTTLGTAKYLAPEQVEGGPVDARTDVYSLGVVLYELLCGRPPFVADTEAATALARLHREPPRPRQVRASVPRPLDEVTMRALARRPEDRFPSASAMRTALLTAARAAGALPDLSTGLTATATVDAGPPTQAGAPAAPPPPRPQPTPPPPPLDGGPPTVGTPGPVPDATAASATAWGRPATPVGGAPPATAPAAPSAPSGVRRRHAAERRRWAAPAVLVAVLGASAGIVVALVLGSGNGGGGGDAPAVSSPEEAIEQGVALLVTGIGTFDPDGDGAERADLAPRAVDGDATTTWQTEGYSTAAFGGFDKVGVGLEVSLEQPAALDQLALDTPAGGWSLEVYVAAAPGADIEAWGPPVARVDDVADGPSSVDLGGASGSAVLVLVTALPDDPEPDGSFRVQIGELALTGTAG